MKKLSVQEGFTLPEVLVAAFLLGMATVAVVGVAVFGTRSALESERQNVALGVVNEKLEQIRVLPYSDVGLLDASDELNEPGGVVTRTETVVSNQQTFEVVVTITNVDDPNNGLVPADGEVDEEDADYKKVEIAVVWTAAGGTQRDVSVVTYVAPSGALRECTPGEETCPGYAGEGACVPFEVCPLSGVCPAPNEQNYFCPLEAVYCRAQTGLCTNNNECGAGEVCNLTTGYCSLACNGTESCECPESFQCNATTGVCDPPSPSPSPTVSPSSSATPSISPTGQPSGPPSGSPPPSSSPSTSPSPSPSSTPSPSTSPIPTASVAHCPVDDPRVLSPGCENIAPIDPGCGCDQRNVTTFVQRTVDHNDPLCPDMSTEQCVPVSVSQSCASPCPSSSLLPSPSSSVSPSPSSSSSASPSGGSNPPPNPSSSINPSTNPSTSPEGEVSPDPSSSVTVDPSVSPNPGPSGGVTSPSPGGGSPNPDPSGLLESCVSSNECGEGLVCTDGQCQGEECLSAASVQCGDGLEPGDIIFETQCTCPGFNQRQITSMQNNPANTGPSCVQQEICQPVTTLETCPTCPPSPLESPQTIPSTTQACILHGYNCDDGLDNDGDFYADEADDGCHTDGVAGGANDPDPNSYNYCSIEGLMTTSTATGCTDDADCVSGNVCLRNVCQPPPSPDETPTQT